MVLGLTQLLTETSTTNISWGVKAAGAKGWQPYHLHVPIVLQSGSLKLLEPSGPVQACNGIILPFNPVVLVCSQRMWHAENTASLPWSVGNREVGLVVIPLLFEEHMIATQHSRRYCELTRCKLHVEHGTEPASRLSITAIYTYSRQTLTSHIPTAGRHQRHSTAGQTNFVQPRKHFSSQFPRFVSMTYLGYQLF